MPLIHLDRVSVSYGRRTALQDVTCDIDGGTVGLLGVNGAGKSTLIKTLLGFLRANRGSVVELFGRALPRHALYVRQRLGYMPERDVVSPKVSAVSFLTYCGCLFGMTRTDAMERAHEVLNYVKVGAHRYRKMETYSTGMCQRVKFAQALIHDPKLLLLDEPTNGLDPEGRIEMLDLVRELAATRNVTILVSSHLLPDIEYVCDRVAMIHQGRLMREGTITELTALCDGAFEVRVRDKRQEFLQRIEDYGFHWRDPQDGNILVSLPHGTEPRALFEIAQAVPTQLRRLRAVRHSLEEVFMQVIGSN